MNFSSLSFRLSSKRNERTQGRKERAKEARENGRQEEVDQKERDGQKGNGQTLVTPGTNLLHSSNLHGKMYGLEVGPWAAAERVPYLCAISLTSSDEEFSETKHVFRETNQDLAECQRDLHMRIDSRVLKKVKMKCPAKLALPCTRQIVSANSGCGRLWMERILCDYGFRICRVCGP